VQLSGLAQHEKLADIQKLNVVYSEKNTKIKVKK